MLQNLKDIRYFDAMLSQGKNGGLLEEAVKILNNASLDVYEK